MAVRATWANQSIEDEFAGNNNRTCKELDEQAKEADEPRRVTRAPTGQTDWPNLCFRIVRCEYMLYELVGLPFYCNSVTFFIAVALIDGILRDY